MKKTNETSVSHWMDLHDVAVISAHREFLKDCTELVPDYEAYPLSVHVDKDEHGNDVEVLRSERLPWHFNHSMKWSL